MSIKNVSIVGLGALGMLYADHIIRHQGAEAVTFVMDPDRVEKYRDTEYTVNDRVVKFNMVSADQAKPADLLILAVKYTGLASALEVMKTSIDEHTIIMSVMNGISSEEEIAALYGAQRIVYTVAQGMDAMRFGSSLRFTQMGALHIGVAPGTDPSCCAAVRAYFEEIKMPYVYEEDILWRLWFKFMLNVGINQICMVYDTPYGGALDPSTEAYRTLIAAMREVKSIANAKGIALTEADINQCLAVEATLDPQGTPSMGQDRINKKKSEADMFAGKVIALGEELNILVPANRYLYQRVGEIEAAY